MGAGALVFVRICSLPSHSLALSHLVRGSLVRTGSGDYDNFVKVFHSGYAR